LDYGNHARSDANGDRVEQVHSYYTHFTAQAAGIRTRQPATKNNSSILISVHLAQAINYLEAYKMDIGQLINFGSRSSQFKMVHNNKIRP
jgi:hypothetical protein